MKPVMITFWAIATCLMIMTLASQRRDERDVEWLAFHSGCMAAVNAMTVGDPHDVSDYCTTLADKHQQEMSDHE